MKLAHAKTKMGFARDKKEMLFNIVPLLMKKGKCLVKYTPYAL